MCQGSIWIIGVQKYPDISTQYALRQTAGLNQLGNEFTRYCNYITATYHTQSKARNYYLIKVFPVVNTLTAKSLAN